MSGQYPFCQEFLSGFSSPGHEIYVSSNINSGTTTHTASGLSLLENIRYYTTVSAHNVAGVMTTRTSDGFMVDTTSPDAGVVLDGAGEWVHGVGGQGWEECLTVICTSYCRYGRCCFPLPVYCSSCCCCRGCCYCCCGCYFNYFFSYNCIIMNLCVKAFIYVDVFVDFT